MTASPTLETQVSAPQNEEPDDAFAAAVAKIVQETGRPEHEAKAGIEFIRNMAFLARNAAREPYDTKGTHHLTGKEMDTLGYEVMDDIMPHGQMSQVGSAHAAVEDVVLDRTKGEYALTHDNPTGRHDDCSVCLNLQAA